MRGFLRDGPTDEEVANARNFLAGVFPLQLQSTEELAARISEIVVYDLPTDYFEHYRHDILTGSQPDGTAFTVAEDRTCGNWTRSGADGAAMVGHHDRRGLNEDPPAKSWNSSHLTRGGCSQEALRGTGGAGLLYCFAAD